MQIWYYRLGSFYIIGHGTETVDSAAIGEDIQYKQKLASCMQGQINSDSSLEEAKWMLKRLNLL
jgi:hypothetical protein